MEIVGYLLAVVMGFTMGLLGGGGSILTVPILVYVLGIEPVLATGYSLFVVGAGAMVGAARKHFEGLIEWPIAITFAVPSIAGVFLARYFLVPAIPEHLATIGTMEFTKDIALMVFFASIMLLASFSMIRGRKDNPDVTRKKINYFKVLAEGLGVGLVTGLVGAGGGFLIVPALVVLVGLPMKKAVGTSLLIISLKSLIGFSGDLLNGTTMEWDFLLIFLGVSLLGLFLGIYVNRFVSPGKLRRGFGAFVLIMALFILIQELGRF